MEQKSLKQLIKKTKELSILYVEGNEIIARNTLTILKKLFINIIFAKDGEEGFLKFNEHHIDIIITDINIPKLDGISMLKKIHDISHDTVVIITTDNNEIKYYQKTLGLNVQGYITKPISLDSLFNILEYIIEKKRNEDIKNNKLNYLLNANKKLLNIGYEISHQKNYNILLQTILLGTKELSNADGGTLYIYNPQYKTLEFKIAVNTTLNVHMGGSKDKITWSPLQLFNEDGSENRKNVAIVTATDDKLVNINDIYKSKSFDFTGAKIFDTTHNYKTTSMLVIPMKNRDNELIGVIQLINKLDEQNNIISFNKDDENLITAFSAQAGMIIENNKLVDDLEKLLYALIKSIGSALDEKSQYTAKHINKVAELSQIIAKGINENNTIFKNITFTREQLETIKLAAWLHDIGKISTPEHIIDKQTKLEKIYDRIENIKTKFEVLKRDIEIDFLKNNISKDEKNRQFLEIDKDLKFLELINHGDKFMSKNYIEKLNNISTKYPTIKIEEKEQKLLNRDELYNLSTIKGTLTKEDREIINNHVIVSYKMLKDIPMPKHLLDVAKVAASHHKTVDGKGGYAHEEIMGLEMTLLDKILAVADVFEALSAQDRPYKEPNTLNQSAQILKSMVQEKHLDKDIVRVFLEDKLYLEYAKEHLSDTQRDKIELDYDSLTYF